MIKCKGIRKSSSQGPLKLGRDLRWPVKMENFDYSCIDTEVWYLLVHLWVLSFKRVRGGKKGKREVWCTKTLSPVSRLRSKLCFTNPFCGKLVVNGDVSVFLLVVVSSEDTSLHTPQKGCVVHHFCWTHKILNQGSDRCVIITV